MQTFILNFTQLLNTTVIPLLIAIAFLVFMWNMTRYFIIGGANEQERVKAKSTALYGIASFVLITCVWGIVNLFVYGFGFTNTNPIAPDYLSGGTLGNGGYGSSFNGNSNSWSSGQSNNSGGGGGGGFWGGGGYNPVGTSLSGGGGNNSGGGGFWSLLFGGGGGGEGTNLSNDAENTQYYDDWGEGANLSNERENNTNENWDNYGYTDGADTNISPDP